MFVCPCLLWSFGLPYFSGGGGGGGFDAGGGPSGGVDQAAVVTRLLQTPVYSASEGRPDGGGREDSLVASRTGEALRLFLFNMMVTIFKGYHIFIRPPDSGSGEEDYGDDAATTVAGGSAAAVERSGGGGGGGGRAGHGQESDVEFDVLGFLSFAQADLRPFLRVLLRTKAFAAFLADARLDPIRGHATSLPNRRHGGRRFLEVEQKYLGG
ncbi:unnamed protein product [Ectocarpus sp. CCAP 1310/34]|nr:unnamed protein product [Ectocarpus sp. CCAP 1310/34]